MDVNLYNVDGDFDQVKRKIEGLETSKKNKDLLLDFADDCLTGWQMRRISKSRTTTLLQRLSRMTMTLEGDWIQFDEGSTKKMLRWIDAEYPVDKHPWSQHGYRIALRKFITWMRRKHGYPKKYTNRTKCVNTLDVSKYAFEVARICVEEPDELRDAQSIPSDQELDWLSEMCINTRDKAWFEMSREHGERIGALGTRKIKHIRFDSLGALVVMHDKTFRGEPVRYISSVMYLRQWLENHPFRNDPEAPLWIDFNKLPACRNLSYDGFRSVIWHLIERHNRRAEKQGLPKITKNITTHLFRYYAQTRDERRRMPRTIMCKIRGWKTDSKQPERYARLSNQDVDDYWKEEYGLTEGKEMVPKPRIVKCQRCKEINAPGAEYCFKCGLPLDPNAVVGLEPGAEMLQRLMTPETINSLIDARVRELLQQGHKKKEEKKGD